MVNFPIDWLFRGKQETYWTYWKKTYWKYTEKNMYSLNALQVALEASVKCINA